MGGNNHSSPFYKHSGFRKGPLRKVVKRMRHGKDIYDRDIVELECGHTALVAIGAKRGRCAECKKKEM